MVTLAFGLAGLVFADLAWHRRTHLPRPAAFWACAGAAAILLIVAMAALPRGAMLQKVLGQLVMPVGLIWVATFAGSFYAWHLRRLRPALAGLSLWVAISIGGNELVGGAAIAALQSDYRELSPREEEPFDVVFVLGGGTSQSPLGEPQLSSSGDRVMLAARLHHLGVAPVLVTSGSSIPGAAVQRDLTRETEAIWRDLGVADDSIVRVPGPSNTSEEIAAYAELASEKDWERIGLVTSAWHMRRATALARAEGLAVTPVPADFRGTARYQGLLSLIPTAHGLASAQLVLWERIGAAVGR